MMIYTPNESESLTPAMSRIKANQAENEVGSFSTAKVTQVEMTESV